MSSDARSPLHGVHAIERLLRPDEMKASALDLEEIDVNLYVAPQAILWRPAGGVGVFGGQVLGQALHAASLTKADDLSFEVHSLHAYFLRPGDASRPIVYRVKRTRDGRSFASRSVEASQGGKVIFKCSVSFHKSEPTSLEHQRTMHNVPPPEALEPFDYGRLVRSLLRRAERDDDAVAAAGSGSSAGAAAAQQKDALSSALVKALDRPFPIDIRWCGKNPAHTEPRPAVQRCWMRTSSPLPDNPHLHRAVATFYSDYFLLATALLPHGVGFPSPRIETLASLDHSMWFHSKFRADEWMLLELESPRACGARGLSFGSLYTTDGVLAVSCAQEGLIRLT